MKSKKQIIGYTTGAFDMFHIGHLNILKRAKENCDYLVVGVATDELIKQMKNTDTIIPFEERIEIVRNIKFVDEAIAKTELDNLIPWIDIKYNVFFKGDDWKDTIKGSELEEQFRGVGVKVHYFPYTKGTSSTELKKTIKKILQK